MTDRNVFESKTAAYYTLGCKLNFAETSALGQGLLMMGIRTAQPNERADICIINTCSVTELADKKCRYMIRKAQREHPGAFVVVTGCYAQLSPEEVSTLEGVHLVVGSEHKLDIPSLLEERMAERQQRLSPVVSASDEISTFQISSSSQERTRHFLKVQDGCDYACTYCTIPKARGRSRNGSIAALTEEARRIARQGGLEIVLTGVNIGDFGKSTGERFVDLLRGLDEVEGIERYRIGSVEPNLLSEEVVDFCATSKRIAPHFHLPLQSGSNEVLRLMRRRYTRELFAQRVAYIRERIPHAYIGVDVIVGTRGERPEYFDDCCRFVEALEVSQLHVFSYSERRGTAALAIPYVVEVGERHRRSQLLQRLSQEKLKAFYQSQLGQSMRVIWEEGQTALGYMTGYSDQYIRVGQPWDERLVGSVSIITPRSLQDGAEGLLLI